MTTLSVHWLLLSLSFKFSLIIINAYYYLGHVQRAGAEELHGQQRQGGGAHGPKFKVQGYVARTEWIITKLPTQFVQYV